jgi:hypothetical protein
METSESDEDMEFANVVAGIGGTFEKTMELKPIKYRDANNGPDGGAWVKEIENKHDRMVKNKALELVKKNSLPRGTEVVDSTWVCKKKEHRKATQAPQCMWIQAS